MRTGFSPLCVPVVMECPFDDLVKEDDPVQVIDHGRPRAPGVLRTQRLPAALQIRKGDLDPGRST